MNRLFYLFLVLLPYSGISQTLFRDFPVLSEKARQAALAGADSLGSSIRPVLGESLNRNNTLLLEPLPVYSISQYSTNRPYGWGDMLMVPNVGFQQYLSTGFNAKWKFLSLRVQPEFIFAQQKGYQGFGDDWDANIFMDRFYVWGRGDFPERFSNGSYSKIWWGQSHLMFTFGSFQTGISTENIWWGPGQFNSLSFSNNAPGFPHLTFKTKKPAKTFLGYFETELLIGELGSSKMNPSQNDSLNILYAKNLPYGNRYLNALMVSYQPKWIPNLRIGFARTFQVYDSIPRDSFGDWLPVFEAFQKEKHFENGHTVDFDENGRDQQIIIFGDLRFPKNQVEIYFEYGKRDHAFNWREFILNPDHGRAYLLGFLKLIDLPKIDKKLQIRAEITQQQESINRLVRYSNSGTSGSGGRNSWHEHAQARGFTNFGQGLGVGVGQGGNVQTFEFTLVDGYDKVGFLLERVARDQGFYYRAFGDHSERKPWIDLSLGFLYDKNFDNLLVSSKLQFIHARNYQWQLDPASTPEIPKGDNLSSVMAQVSLIYFWNKTLLND